VSGAFRVLFLCTGNSARSQIAEALLNHDGAGRFAAESAGTEPAARVNPGAVEALAAAGIDWHGHSPRSVDGLDGRPWDLVITVCDDARESCPIFPAGPVIAHWGMPDPAAVQGGPAAKRAAFLDTLGVLRRRIEALVKLPVEELARPELQERVQAIGSIR
jgi:arsenate reductase (thioredoxin)